MIGKYRDIEITIDEINEYKNNYELIDSKFLIKKEKINKLQEEFEIIKDLYNLEDNDIRYLNRIVLDKQKNSNLETTGITLKEYNNRTNTNSFCFCITFISIVCAYFIILAIITAILNK